MSDRTYPPEPEDPTFTIAPRPGIRVYYNPFGDVVVRNFTDEHAGDMDADCEHIGCSFVRFEPKDAPAIIKAIQQVVRELKK
jgi:hypothetical protein